MRHRDTHPRSAPHLADERFRRLYCGLSRAGASSQKTRSHPSNPLPKSPTRMLDSPLRGRPIAPSNEAGTTRARRAAR
jgi:hypothetical protein